MAEQTNRMRLSGWGRYPSAECAVYRPEKREEPAKILRGGPYATFTPRGLGRSYGDQAINSNGAVIALPRLDRLIAFDESSGLLHCEAGVSFADIIETFLPRGWFLPTTPGTKFVTVGGAIANDVHGKNHHRDGSFGNAVEEIELLTASGETLVCSPSQLSDVFWATIGGSGLTGLIMSAKFYLRPVPSAYYLVDYVRTPGLKTTLAKLEETDADYQYSVAWVDCLARDSQLGRSILMLGNYVQPEQLGRRGKRPYHVRPRRTRSVPFSMPGFVLTAPGQRAVNAAIYAWKGRKKRRIEDFDTYHYPLDSIANWNRLYGRRGFIQYQVTVPTEQRDALTEMIEAFRDAGHTVFLAVLKKFGPANDGMLSYPFEGFTLTLDVAVRKGLVEFLHGLDQRLVGWGGRLYLAKDATMTPESFRAMYPRLDEFLEVQHRLDPEGRWSSHQARRLGLVRGTG